MFSFLLCSSFCIDSEDNDDDAVPRVGVAVVEDVPEVSLIISVHLS